MISFDKAFETALERARLLDAETVSLGNACGRILAEDVKSDLNMPPFDKSAMDGYACRRGDLPGPLRVVEMVQAGTPPKRTVEPGECAKIMTGAMVPRGADCVVMIEHTEMDEADMVCFTKSDTATNICYCGEDVRKGDVVLRRGVRMGTQHVAVLASVGCVAPLVARCPRVAVIATGDELIEPDGTPGPSQIRNSNSYQICAQIEQTGASARYYGIASDNVEALDAVVKRALAEKNDVLLLSGGVSMGDFDLVPGVMEDNGFQILFDSIAMKPGKPTTFGTGEKAYCFGLPGNPVSTFIQCEMLVKPFLYKMMGHCYRPPFALHPLAETYSRKKTERASWMPVMLNDDNTVSPAAYHGSAHINALCDAYGLLLVPQGVGVLEKGALMRVNVINALG